ncbi:MAG: helix-turn-helix domain-containing protein [Anaerolineae bacterium]|nr:helix-turn-helix domain-containing protein [Anaerolineae bacterium]
MRRRVVHLNAQQRSELVHLRDHAPKAYLRERAAAILKIAGGQSARSVALNGLLKPRDPDSVRGWLNRYLAEGVKGLYIRPGRGRKPAFSPSGHRHRPRRARTGPAASSLALWGAS